MAARLALRTELEDIADQLRAQDIPAALDRDKVQVPGVWVTIASVGVDGLGFYTIHAALYVTTADRETAPTLGDMDDTVNKILAMYDPEGDLTPATVRRAGVDLPALRVPVDFRCEYAAAPPVEES